MEKPRGKTNILEKMKKTLMLLVAPLAFLSCEKTDYIIGGENNPTNQVNMTTMAYLETNELTQETAKLFERAGLASEVNGEVTVFAPSIYAINRYLRRQNNRRLRLDPDSPLMTADDISVDELQQLKMYLVPGNIWRETIPEEGLTVSTLSEGDSIRVRLVEVTADPGAAWDGGSAPGAGYQYPNFMQTTPQLIEAHFKRGDSWESTLTERLALGYDNPECDQVYQMYLSD